MIARSLTHLLALCLLAAPVLGQITYELLPEEDEATPETLQLVWETEPGVRYEVEQSTDLSEWTTVEGYPAEASSTVDALSFGGVPGSGFLRVKQYDEQPPELVVRTPEDGGFAVGRFSPITMALTDLTGVDPASIHLTVGALGSFTLADPRLSYAAGVLTFDYGDDPLGAYDTTVDVSLTVADTLGFSAVYDWSFLLEKEAIVAENVLVLNSVEAQRAGQQLTPGQRAVFRQVSPAVGPIRMNTGAAPWTLTEVGETYLLFSYSGATPPSFQTGQFLANLAPERENEVFYRKVISTADDAAAQELTVTTEDVSILEIVSQASLFLTPATYAQGIYRIGEDGLLVDTQTSVLLGDTFTHSVDFAESAVSFELAGGWEFEPSLRLAMDIQGAEVEDFYCRFDGRSSIYVAPSISVSGAVEATASTTHPILKAGHIFYLGQAGPVPIWVDMDFTLHAEAGVTMDAAATVSTSIERTESFYMEAAYSSRNPALNGFDYSPPTAKLDVAPVTFLLEGHGHAYARLVPQVDVRLESIFGVYANIVPEVGLTGDATLLNGELETATVELYGRVDLNAGLSLIGFEAGDLPSLDPVELAYFPWRYDYPEPEALQITTQPADTPVQVGRGLVLRCVAVDDLPISYRWFKDGAPLPGEVAAELRIDRATLSDAGDYTVRLRSGSGEALEEVFSEPARVTVTEPGAAPAGMVRVAGGTLAMSMGTVSVDTFYMDKHEVTWSEWKAVRAQAGARGYDIGSVGAGCADDHPVRSVNWYDVVKWCNLKSELEGLTPVYSYNGSTFKQTQPTHTSISQNLSANGYRLPQEAEWEFAARGGNQSNGTTYAGSNDLNAVGWYWDNSGGAACNLSSGRGTWPVGQKAANELGLYDMSGNVWEWCWDQNGSFRRNRGGSWDLGADRCTVSRRSFFYPDGGLNRLGFRVARSSGN